MSAEPEAVARFRVTGSFSLPPPRSLFVVSGQVADGVVRRGQRVIEPAGIDAPVHGLEYLRLRPSSGTEERALTFVFPDPETLGRWKVLVQPGIELVLAH
ncbi:MAG TPA: hypothetical protein VFJ82_26820 [Longimicrobium sp.]|nr:hypothetical protein [Longimicrobium sp.]